MRLLETFLFAPGLPNNLFEIGITPSTPPPYQAPTKILLLYHRCLKITPFHIFTISFMLLRDNNNHCINKQQAMTVQR